MKAFRRLVAACTAALMVSSCSILQNVASSATSVGTNTGSAIAGLYQIVIGYFYLIDSSSLQAFNFCLIFDSDRPPRTVGI